MARIFLIEDETPHREAAAGFFRSHEYQVDEAWSYESFRSHWEADPSNYAAILSDYNFGGRHNAGNGLMIYELVRPDYPRLPFIGCSAKVAKWVDIQVKYADPLLYPVAKLDSRAWNHAAILGALRKHRI